jgi:hypothetical protein
MDYMLSPQDYELMVQQFDGDVEAANAMLRERGYSIPGEEPSSLAVMNPNMNPAAGGDDDEEETSDLSVDPNSLAGVLAGQRKSIGALYDKITQNIQQRYRKPDLNDLLVQVGMGMLSPPGEDDDGGFGGAVKRGLRGVGSYAQSLRAYETDMNKMLSNLEIEKAKQMAALEGKYLTSAAAALKPKKSQQSWSGELQRFVSPDEPAPTQRTIVTKSGISLTQYTDGSLRFINPDGSQDVYDPATGRKIGTAPSKGMM